jgi:methylthioribose-1-phosphate isomerase
MKIHGHATRSVWIGPDGWSLGLFDQRRLPWFVERLVLNSDADAAEAIATMATRGAPLIGVVGAYGLAFGLRADPSDTGLAAVHARLAATRPTAVNLRWALDRVAAHVRYLSPADRAAAAHAEAGRIADEDVAMNRAIGAAGLPLLADIAAGRQGTPLRVLIHCNPGWLATVDWGTATAPIYRAHDAGIPVHVWVDETRPRNQGALTAFELAEHGVPHTVVVDNACGYLMQRGEVDLVLVGTDRVTANGDVCNKIGTYLKALAARAHAIPFYVALPSSTYDPATASGEAIPIETRSADEVRFVEGPDAEGILRRVAVTASPAANPAFDVTPAALVSAWITDRGTFTSPADLARAMRQRSR